jgi:multidrug resistance efflux pump
VTCNICGLDWNGGHFPQECRDACAAQRDEAEAKLAEERKKHEADVLTLSEGQRVLIGQRDEAEAKLAEARAALDYFASLTRMGMLARSEMAEAIRTLKRLGYEGFSDDLWLKDRT